LQGVDIHEPVRLLMVVEAPAERIACVLDRLPAVKTLVVNRWIQLAALDPATGRLAVHEAGGSVVGFTAYAPEAEFIPTAASSHAWYRGRRGNVPPATLLCSAAGRVPEAKAS